MYTPIHSQKMSDLDSYQIRCALQGDTGSGKTFSALTFPNPVVADLDNNLTAHKHRSDIIRLPFKDNVWIKSWFPFDEKRIKFPIRDSLLKWISTEGMKLEKDQSFLLDSWTTTQDAFDQQTILEPVLTKSGGIDEFAFWDRKQDYSRELLGYLAQMKCHVIVTFHQQETRTGQGELLGKTEPLMQGKFVKKLGLYFTEWYQCVVEPVLDPTDKKKIISNKYFWKTKSTNEVNLKSRMTNCPMLIEPNFKSIKYE